MQFTPGLRRVTIYVTKFAFIFGLTLPVQVNAVATMDPSKQNVVLITLDGVRWQEFFSKSTSPDQESAFGTYFYHFWKTLAEGSFIIGNRYGGPVMTTGNPRNLSLPGYQTLFSGFYTGCKSNACGQIRYETFAERLVRENGFSRSQVAVISSWQILARAVEKNPGTLFTNSGISSLDDGSTDPSLSEINQAQAAHRPIWKDGRFDRYTHAQALRYLKKHQPRFLMIGYGDADEWAHRSLERNYRASLLRYDRWIKEVATTLEEMGDYGKNTTLIVTVDHGRGNGFLWPFHGAFPEASKYTWLFARGPATRSLQATEGSGLANQSPSRRFTLRDLRPSIEKLFGLTPQSCYGCGNVLPEIAGTDLPPNT